MQFAINHDYKGFAARELADRQEAFYPPFCKISQIRIQGKNKTKVEAAASAVAGAAVGAALRGCPGCPKVLGPTEPFISRVQKNHRMAITIKTANATDMKNAIKSVLANPAVMKASKGVEVRVDRDC
jgi:primosomal protein N' (replication factor Y) (superfamily II helicase)